MRLDELDDSSLDVDDDRRGHGRIIALTAPATCRIRAANVPRTSRIASARRCAPLRGKPFSDAALRRLLRVGARERVTVGSAF